MNRQDVSQKLNVSLSLLKRYEKAGLFDQVKINDGQYTNQDIQRLSLILSLEKVGLSLKQILEYINNEQKRLNILKYQRNHLLDVIHQNQKNLEILDCLIYHLKGENKHGK